MSSKGLFKDKDSNDPARFAKAQMHHCCSGPIFFFARLRFASRAVRDSEKIAQ
jgi:hypothetical protein